MGLVVLDAGVIIGFLDGDDLHHTSCTSIVEHALAAGERIAVPASAYAETLVGPARRGFAAIAAVERFGAQLPVGILDLDREIALDAAKLRAKHGTKLRLPDALVVATARVHDATTLVTTDRGWPSARSLQLPGLLRVL